MLKRNVTLLLLSLFFMMTTSCSKEDKVSCTTCRSDQTPDFELCKESNGNASVNGEDTEVPYTIYLSDLENNGIICQ